ncbi:MAG: SufD family Fe-S cluster assembly protein [Clostridia bacterium]|nr:SufD family Fe-S cluster assembly protein [Clostridia bacterium]
MAELSAIQKNMLKEIAGYESIPEGAYNLRSNGTLAGRRTTANIDIQTKTDKPGIDIIIKPGTKNERVDIPVILTQTGLNDLVYNDFYIGEGADVLIVAGCGIHNAGGLKSEHDGIHAFHVGKDARVKYVENHYGEGEGTGERILNPTTEIEIDEGGYMEMETSQIRGVDSTYRKTRAKLGDKAILVIKEKILTHGHQKATTDFVVDLDGVDSGAHVISRSVATEDSYQKYMSCVNGNNRCNGHTECDAILMDNGQVDAVPMVNAHTTEARLIHEAAIGKIAGEQLDKLMTLGLTEKEAEEEIVNGFLR